MSAASIQRVGPDRVDDLAALWKAVQAYQVEVADRIEGVPMRHPDDSWPRRRAEYLEWLAEPDAFLLLATGGDAPVAYALVTVQQHADDTHVTGDRVAELKSLSVAASRRGEGLGSAMMLRVFEELRALGVTELKIGVLAGNDRAFRFYERFGFRPWLVETLGRVPDGA